ncbi:hypothetical protein HUU61_15815 [Rhodopseudomonas palustris]|nr:hypothetical protein [Rhodopseudomonas palustris]
MWNKLIDWILAFKDRRWVVAAAAATSFAGLLIAIVTWLIEKPPALIDAMTRVELPMSYPNETWTRIRASELHRLSGRWCYQGRFSGLEVTLVVNDGEVVKNGKPLLPYISNQGLIRLVDQSTGKSDFIQHAAAQPYEMRTFSRYVSDGQIKSWANALALNCERCMVKHDQIGGSYECR